MDNTRYIPGLKRPVREIEQFTLPSVKIKNKQSNTSKGLQDLYRETFNLQLKMVGSFIKKK